MAKNIEPERVMVDPGTFTGKERRTLQRRFGCDFELLTAYANVAAGSALHRDEAVPIVGPTGQKAYSDEVLIALINTVRLRDNPKAVETDLEDMTLVDLRESFETPKAKRPTTSDDDKTKS